MELELIGSLFLILAVALLVAMFISRPFMRRTPLTTRGAANEKQQREHLRSSLMAEHDRVLNALQELDFDYTLGKIPAEDYPEQRGALLRIGADVLRRLDAIQPAAGLKSGGSVEDRIEAAVAARRADASRQGGRKPAPVSVGTDVQVAANGSGKAAHTDSIEDIIASRKRERKESSAGFCPRCGRPVQKSDKFCSKCGTTL